MKVLTKYRYHWNRITKFTFRLQVWRARLSLRRYNKKNCLPDYHSPLPRMKVLHLSGEKWKTTSLVAVIMCLLSPLMCNHLEVADILTIRLGIMAQRISFTASTPSQYNHSFSWAPTVVSCETPVLKSPISCASSARGITEESPSSSLSRYG